MSPIRIGVLDFGDLSLAGILRTARLADALGYGRYWLAEHVGGANCTGGRPYTNSLLMLSLIAGSTERIRVGTAGVLLRYFAAAAVARDAVFLEQVFGRVDLGLSAGTIAPPWEEMFVDGRAETASRAYFDAKVESVVRWIAEYAPRDDRPELWLHTSSGALDRIRPVAALGANLAVSLFHAAEMPPTDVIRKYREESGGQRGSRAGHAVVALAMACLESARERSAYVSPHTVSRTFADVPALCRERVEELCHSYDTNEVVILESSTGSERRAASLNMLADAFNGLSGPTPTSSSGVGER